MRTLATSALSDLHVCSLGGLPATAAALHQFDLLTLLSPGYGHDAHRALACGRHLELSFHDITEPRAGLIAPDRATMDAMIAFGRELPRPMLIHCWAGVSRSSAAAYVLACARNAGRESDIADELRRRAPFATPNRLMVALADDLLGRNGAMVAAIDRIGRGVDAREGWPYRLPARWPIEALP